ncbi:MAG TPA: prepilin-type N-terminal cleavage/methylation domain-containing protein [Syntrophales bacterium]|nr:prepilin-type N-terminal cleavage/methylation domain-containing protein [Syntrophales bacterium]HOL58493.1 prepilin-type N-terminal cleavage/methylation domain-containing protein [Syntrophales bacterium]HPO34899.1 prepilin-type N-terminal cleavage/methylation domain-containing protein [Syntrophales bacterium]
MEIRYSLKLLHKLKRAHYIHSPEGFTLLEVMIAMSILAIVLVAVFQSQSFSVSVSHDSKFLTTASYLSQICVAEIEMRGAAPSGSMKGTFGENYPNYLWQVEVLSSPIPGTKKFKITVSNKEISPPREFVTYYYGLER